MVKAILNPLLHALPESNRLERIWKIAQVDFRKRYYNDNLGLFWALFNPLFKIFVYYFVFKIVLNRGEDNFAMFLFTGLLLWMVFAESTKMGMRILFVKKDLIESIKFERIDLFLSHALSVFMAFLFNLVAYFIIAGFTGVSWSWKLIFLPVLILTIFTLCVAVSLILSSLYIYFKDISHVWDITLMLGFWTSGIFFKVTAITNVVPAMIYLNPYLGIIENGRKILFYDEMPDLLLLGYNLLTAILLLGIAYFVFIRYHHKMLERI